MVCANKKVSVSILRTGRVRATQFCKPRLKQEQYRTVRPFFSPACSSLATCTICGTVEEALVGRSLRLAQ